jgi:hypothetical protein
LRNIYDEPLSEPDCGSVAGNWLLEFTCCCGLRSNNRDGYVYRLYALLPSRWSKVNPHHLLWDYVQILLAELGSLSGHSTTVPFQLFGIAVNCVTLLLFFPLLREVSGSRMFSAAGTVLVAFSPKFWFLGFQNQPYPLMFLAVVLYLRAWWTPDGTAPVGLRFVAAGACMVAAIFHSDLAGQNETFSPFVEKRYAEVKGGKLFDDVQRFFHRYSLARSDFAIGVDQYLILHRR